MKRVFSLEQFGKLFVRYFGSSEELFAVWYWVLLRLLWVELGQGIFVINSVVVVIFVVEWGFLKVKVLGVAIEGDKIVGVQEKENREQILGHHLASNILYSSLAY